MLLSMIFLVSVLMMMMMMSEVFLILNFTTMLLDSLFLSLVFKTLH